MAILHPRVTVTVNGIPRRTLGGTTSTGFRSSFATANIQFARDEPAAVPGDVVQVTLGYLERGSQVVFVGEVDDDNLDYWPQRRAVTCSGFLARMQRGIGVEDTGADPDPDTGIYPAYQGDSVTDDQVVTALLALYGIAAGDIQGDSPTQTFGTLPPGVTLGKDEPAWSLVSELDRLTFMRTFDAPDGTVRRQPVNGIPSFAALTLTEGVSILGGSRARTRRGIVNRVTMTGRQDADGLGDAPRAERFAPSPYIPTPPTYVSEEWTSELAETEEACDRYAGRRVGQLNRLQESVTVRVERCRPDIYPAMSLAIDAEHFEYDANTLFWVEQVQHSWDARGIHTDLGLLAANAASGINPNQRPIALIALTMHVETLADGTTRYVVNADGRASYDPDGAAIDLDPQHGITGYLWSGDPAGPATPAGLPTATYVYDSDPTGARICLTVADTSLRTGTACVTITAAMVAKAGRRDLWLALTTDLKLTTDAGATWQSTGFAAVGMARIAHPLYQLAYNDVGIMVRVVVDDAGDFTTESIATVTGITAASISLGPDGNGTGRAWAGGSGGEVWFSAADGITGSWSHVSTISPPASAADATIRAIEESPFASGTVYALCGPTLFRSNDRGVSWVEVKTYPDHALNATRLASGRFADLTSDNSYQWVVWAGTSLDTASRIDEGTDQESVDWPVPARPAQPTGLTIGLTAPELFVSDVGGAGTGRIYGIDDFTGGGTLSLRTYDTAFGPPRDLLRDGTYETIYGIGDDAAFKSDDKFATVVAIYICQGSEVGAMVAYGRLRGAPPALGALTASVYRQGDGAVRKIIRRANGRWSALSDHPDTHALADFGALTDRVVRPLCHAGGEVYLTYAYGMIATLLTIPDDMTNCYRSVDGGLTWDALATIASVVGCEIAADGTLYALAQNGKFVHRSTDQGATWEEVYALSPILSEFGGYVGLMGLSCDPVAAGTVAVLNADGIRVTTDGFATVGTVKGPINQVHSNVTRAVARTPSGSATVFSRVTGGPTNGIYRAADAATGGTLASGAIPATLRRAGALVWATKNQDLPGSPDDGATWASRFVTGLSCGDVAYDPATGVWYTATDGQVGTKPTWHLSTDAATWQDITTGQLAGTGADDWVCSEGGMTT